MRGSRCRWALLACALVVAGCRSAGGLAGSVAGAASGGASGNPALGVAVGIGVRSVVDQSVKYVLKYWSDEEQTRIAAAVGALEVGQKGTWEVRHAVPYDNKQGEVTVVRSFVSALATCKEALFSVSDPTAAPAGTPWFTAVACQHADGWKWAVAEPAVARWGALH